MEILSQHMCTDLNDSFGHNFLSLCGYSMSQRAAQLCYHDTGLTPSDLDILEVHDCFAPNEVGGAFHLSECDLSNNTRDLKSA